MALLTKHNLELAKLASKEESRFTLSGILVQPESTVVTDGHILVEVGTSELKAEGYPHVPGQAEPTDEWKPFVLPAESADRALKDLKSYGRSTIPVLEHAAVLAQSEVEKGEEFATIITTDMERSNPIVTKRNGNTFPDYKRMIASAVQPGEEEFSVEFDANLLAPLFAWIGKAGAAGKRAGKTPAVWCTLRFNGSTEPMRIDAKTESGEKITALACARNAGKMEGAVVDTAAGVIRKLERMGKENSHQVAEAKAQARVRLDKLRAQVKRLEELTAVD